MKKMMLLFAVIWTITAPFVAAETEHELLQKLIRGKEWEGVGALFSDSSFSRLTDYFAPASAIAFASRDAPDRLTFRAAFPGHGEAGVITFTLLNGRFSHLNINPYLRPILFIESFAKHPVRELRITLGDATLYFREGFFYRSSPFPFLLLFEGVWQYTIRPSDKEERLTLERRQRKDTLTLTNNVGLFVLPEQFFPAELGKGEANSRPGADLMRLLALYDERYSLNNPQFNEYWRLPLPEDSAIIFFPAQGGPLHIHLFDPNTTPDTQLVNPESQTPLLAYNSVKGLKMRFASGNPVESMKLSLYYTPGTERLSGTVQIFYTAPSAIHTLSLSDSLTLAGNLDTQSKNLNLFHHKDSCQLLGEETNFLALFFKGTIRRSYDNQELFGFTKKDLENYEMDTFYYLSRGDNFYPNPGAGYFKTSVTLNIPEGMNGLASGDEVQKAVVGGGRKTLEFSSRGAQGVSLVCGDFREAARLNTAVPLIIHCSRNFNYKPLLDEEEVAAGFNFLCSKYGAPGVDRVNILLARSRQEGGVSNTGFLLANINPNRNVRNTAPARRGEWLEPRALSPVLLRDDVSDYVIHELAHQWWGELMAPDSWADLWISEGLAHFSTIWFLKNHLPLPRFMRLEEKLKRWILRFNDWGPVGFGSRIHSLENNYDAYQSIVYNKSAFVFFMLMEIVGEADFLARLRGVLEKYARRTVTTAQFIRAFAGTDKTLTSFFQQWIHSRRLPEIHVTLNRRTLASGYDIVVRQLTEEKIFPLKFIITSRSGESSKTFLVTDARHEFILDVPPDVISVKPDKTFSLYRMK